MLNTLSKTLLGFAFLITSSNAISNYEPSKEIVRYIFLFHQSLTAINQITDSLSFRISQDIDTNSCISSSTINQIALENKNPRAIISAISKYVTKNCSNNPKQLKREFNIKDYDLYVMFSSEWSNNVESSFGHIRLAFMKKRNYMFDPTFTFSAYNFYSPDNPDSGFLNYLKAAFSSVEGRQTQNFFFDNYYETVNQETRAIHRFKVIIEETNKYKLYESLKKSLNTSRDYNFFSRNCSSESLRLINEYSGTHELKSTVPSKHIKLLLDNGIIEYTDTFNPQNENNKSITYKEDSTDTVIYDDLSAISLGNKSLSLSLYKSPRQPINDTPIFNNTELLKLELDYINKKNKLVFFNKHLTADIKHKKPSIKIQLGHNTDNEFYTGAGLTFKNIAFDTMLGYSSKLNWSSFSSLRLKKQNFDFFINLRSNINRTDTEAGLNIYLSKKALLTINSSYSLNDIEITYLF